MSDDVMGPSNHVVVKFIVFLRAVDLSYGARHKSPSEEIKVGLHWSNEV